MHDVEGGEVERQTLAEGTGAPHRYRAGVPRMLAVGRRGGGREHGDVVPVEGVAPGQGGHVRLDPPEDREVVVGEVEDPHRATSTVRRPPGARWNQAHTASSKPPTGISMTIRNTR